LSFNLILFRWRVLDLDTVRDEGALDHWECFPMIIEHTFHTSL